MDEARLCPLLFESTENERKNTFVLMLKGKSWRFCSFFSLKICWLTQWSSFRPKAAVAPLPSENHSCTLHSRKNRFTQHLLQSKFNLVQLCPRCSVTYSRSTNRYIKFLPLRRRELVSEETELLNTALWIRRTLCCPSFLLLTSLEDPIM